MNRDFNRPSRRTRSALGVVATLATVVLALWIDTLATAHGDRGQLAAAGLSAVAAHIRA